MNVYFLCGKGLNEDLKMAPVSSFGHQYQSATGQLIPARLPCQVRPPWIPPQPLPDRCN